MTFYDCITCVRPAYELGHEFEISYGLPEEDWTMVALSIAEIEI